MSGLQSELLFEFEFETLGSMPEVEAGPAGLRVLAPMKHGRFRGPLLKGRMLPDTATDALLVRSDGAGIADVRCTLETDEGAQIYMSYSGFLHPLDATLIERINSGEAGPAEYYLRTSVRFETGSEKYGWLNRIVAVGVGRIAATHVHYDVYEIK